MTSPPSGQRGPQRALPLREGVEGRAKAAAGGNGWRAPGDGAGLGWGRGQGEGGRRGGAGLKEQPAQKDAPTGRQEVT